MGSFNTTCALTRSIIDSSTEVVMLMMTRMPLYREMPVYAWDLYSPIPILFEGTYSGYGTLEKLKLFQSQNLLNDNELKEVGKLLAQDFQAKFVKDNKKPFGSAPMRLEKIFAERDLAFVQKNTKVEMAKQVLSMLDKREKILEKEDKEKLQNMDLILDALGFKSVEDAEKYIKENEGSFKTVPVSFMMMRKDVFMKFVNEYGTNDNDEDHYAPKIQEQRKLDLRAPQNDELKDMMNFMTVANSFAGANRPAYAYDDAIKGVAKNAGKVREDMIALSKLHCLDVTLLNEYLSVLGIPFQPTMYVSEDIASYGHKEAFAMQQTLMKSTEATKKPKP